MHLGVLHQVVLPAETLSTLGPLAGVSEAGVNVPVRFEVLALAEALAAVVPLAKEGLLGDETALAARLAGSVSGRAVMTSLSFASSGTGGASVVASVVVSGTAFNAHRFGFRLQRDQRRLDGG